MNFREFIKILKSAFNNALLKVKNDDDFHKILGISYIIEKAIKKNKNF